MAITTRDKLIDALGNNSSRVILDKSTITGLTAGNFVSMWRATGQPGQGAIPSTAATVNNTATGAVQFFQQTAPATSYLAYLDFVSSNSAMTLELHDRLMHMGGLSGTVTTAQTVGIDFNGITADNKANRIGDTNYSDIQWWLEWYAATGGTAANITVNVTYNDGTTGALTTFQLAATRPIAFMQPLNSYIPAAASGKYIRGIVSVQLAATTGTAGNFGVTATRPRVSVSSPLLNLKASADWAQLPLSEVPNGSALFPIMLTSTTSTGTLRGSGKIAHG